jgi:hypothetical protein
VIRAEKKFERKDEKENYHFMERSYGMFQRALRLLVLSNLSRCRWRADRHGAQVRAAGTLPAHSDRRHALRREWRRRNPSEGRWVRS